MTKQEEIREGIEGLLKYTEGAGTFEWIAEQLMIYLHSQGLVIKVEGELPDTLTIKKGAYPSVETVGCLSVEGEWVRKEAAEAFEPLISG